MFDSLPAWFWVTVAWAELLVVYGGYLWYLNRRAKRTLDNEDDI